MATGKPVSDHRCPCCRTLNERGGFEICPVCFWEDDGQDDHDADIVRGGPNRGLSLTEARRNYATCGAADPINLFHARPPTASEREPTIPMRAERLPADRFGSALATVIPERRRRTQRGGPVACNPRLTSTEDVPSASRVDPRLRCVAPG
ncbi:CPCC family cysteine-rich protein [Methylorubrum aminovorans]